jgi:5,10-methylenetetrahydromethanopterin reductase
MGGMTVSISCALPPTLKSPDLAVLAEQLGYERVWLYDTPALQLDVWMTLALIAHRTTRIGLGPGVLIPSLRHVVVTAAAIAQLEALAPGRTAYGFGAGFTGRRAMGQKPMRWSDVEQYIQTLQSLLRGATVEVDGAAVALLHGTGDAPALPIEPRLLMGTAGPKGEDVARRLGAGVLASSPVGGFGWSVLLWQGTVFDDGEAAGSERVREAAGAGAAVQYHSTYERKNPRLASLPSSDTWRASIEMVDESTRHLSLHRGHLTRLNEHDRLAVTGEVAASLTRSGSPARIAELIHAAAAAGATEIAYQPSGPDPERELHAFMAAARP